MIQSTTDAPSTEKLIGLGILRCSFLFFIEQPLEFITVAAQAEPKTPSSWAVSRKIYHEKGIKEFYSTVKWTLLRRVFKESLRWTVVGYTHNNLVKYFPTTFTQEGMNTKVVTGLFVAAVDSVVILPIEQLITFRVKEGKFFADFMKHRFSTQGMGSFYKGFLANYIRQNIMWSTVLPLNSLVKKEFEKYDTENKYSYIKQALTSVTIATACVTWVKPFDFIKSRILMDPHLQNKNLPSVVHTLFCKYRFRQFYAGALPIFIHTVFHTTISGQILDELFKPTKHT